MPPERESLMYDLVSLGELMLRLSPPKFERMQLADSFDVRPAGAQFNVAANLALLGRRTVFLTRLPDNELGYMARAMASKCGVDMSHVKFVPEAKMGLVFVEFSVAPRAHQHIYDRAESAASSLSATDFPWNELLSQAHFAHVDGIVPNLSPGCREATRAFLQAAKASNCQVSFDVNYRSTLWTPEAARHVYSEILPDVTILITNRDVAERVFGYEGDDEALLQRYRDAFGCELVIMTYRKMEGVLRGSWRSVALYDSKVVKGRPFSFDVVDRFGTGDAFLAGFLFAHQEGRSIKDALNFGNALCALAHTIDGDVAAFSAEEVEAILKEDYAPLPKR